MDINDKKTSTIGAAEVHLMEQRLDEIAEILARGIKRLVIEGHRHLGDADNGDALRYMVNMYQVRMGRDAPR